MASILVVDADSESRSLVAGGLREMGHVVSEASDADSALAAVRTTLLDLVVCDFSLPDLPGIELLRSVRRDEGLPAMRVLMTSEVRSAYLQTVRGSGYRFSVQV